MQLFQLSVKDLEEREKLGLKYLEKHHEWDKIIIETKRFYKDIYRN